ncbi:MAG: penicillin-binding transpeptidase domain-containing protein [Anaerocolumna sp.]
MIDIIWEKVKQVLSSRLLPISLIFIFLIGLLVNRIFTLQIVEGEAHSTDLALKYTKTREIKSTRGNIYDRNGILLAYNKLTYSVVLEESTKLATNQEKNDMLYNLVLLLEKYGNTIENEFGISIDKDGKLYFNIKDTAELRFKKDAFGLRSIDDLTKDQKAATADEVFNYLRHGDGKYNPMFNISDEYSLEDALKIMTLRYAIFTNYPKYNQIIISTHVSDETVAAIYENSSTLPGVAIEQQTYRVYNDSIYNSDILGYTGLINSEELDALPEGSTYNSSDVIGKTGIEKEFESYLSGKKGLETISVNSAAKYLETLERNDPIAGGDVYLTIDDNYQKAFYKIIERSLAGILLSKINNSTDAGTRGTSTKNIRIPIYDVYFALINNNVIDINAFTEDDATSLEKQVNQKFLAKQDEVLADIKDILALDSTTVNSAASDEMQDYLSYIYDELRDVNVLISSKIDKEDTTYKDYIANKISLSKLLQYAIANNWIDLNKLNVGDEYFSTDELYEKLLDYIKNLLLEDNTFHKKIYKDLVYSYKLSGTEISLLLFDQGVIKYNEEDISKLENGTMSAYSFITRKIENLEITPAQLALDPCSASIVVTDVKTGDVLAMVSYPSYDNNKFANKIDPVYYAKVNNDLTYPSINRAAKQRTAPGSTFKMVTSTAVLEEGVLSPAETVYDHVKFDKITPSPSCWSSTSHGAVDITTALEVSCNYFFYEMGWRLGLDSTGINRDKSGLEKLAKYASLYGLDRKSGIELEEAEPQISDKDSVRSAIGQGTNNYTPVQLVRYLTAVATSGTLYDLTLIDKVVDKDGTVILDNNAKSKKLSQVSNTTWNLIHDGMYKVANGSRSSSSYVFKNFPVTVAGKTGTAQESKSRANHALFLSYAPYDNPEIAVAVVIPNGYASSNAVELARNIYSYYFNVGDKDKLVNGKAILPESDSPSFTD